MSTPPQTRTESKRPKRVDRRILIPTGKPLNGKIAPYSLYVLEDNSLVKIGIRDNTNRKVTFYNVVGNKVENKGTIVDYNDVDFDSMHILTTPTKVTNKRNEGFSQNVVLRNFTSVGTKTKNMFKMKSDVNTPVESTGSPSTPVESTSTPKEPIGVESLDPNLPTIDKKAEDIKFSDQKNKELDITKAEDKVIADNLGANSKVIKDKKPNIDVKPQPTIASYDFVRTGDSMIDNRMDAIKFLQMSMELMEANIGIKSEDGKRAVTYADYKNLIDSKTQLEKEIKEIKNGNFSKELEMNQMSSSIQKYHEGMIKEENIQIQLATQKNAKDSAESLLSKNQVGGTGTTSAITGDTEKISKTENISTGIGKTNSLQHETLVTSEGSLINQDNNISSSNNKDNALLSAMDVDEVVDLNMKSTHSSAQAALAYIKEGEITIGSSTDKLKVIKENLKFLADKRVAVSTDVTLSPNERQSRLYKLTQHSHILTQEAVDIRKEVKSIKAESEQQKLNITRFKAEDTAKKQKEISVKQELENSGGHIEGMANLGLNATETEDLSAEEQIQKFDVYLKALEIDALNVQTAPTTSINKTEDELSEITGADPVADVFSPSDHRKKLSDAQKHEMLQLNPEQIKEVKQNLAIYYDEYKLTRLNVGVTEAEALGSRLFTSDNSSRRAASQVRGDISTREEDYGDFMVFLLHDKPDLGNAKWTLFLEASAAFGYNNLTEAQINYLITLNVNGDLGESVIFGQSIDEEHVELETLRDLAFDRETIESLNTQVASAGVRVGRYPSRDQGTSDVPTDNSTHPDGSTGDQRRSNVSGATSGVLNIPDPRTSERGGIDIPNTRQVTIKNRNYVPGSTLKPGDPKYEPQFTQMDVPDVAAGSKDIQAQIEAAEADRLLNSQPQNLYPSVHPQACDRYLGSRNYKRLGVPNEEYMAKYSQHGWGIDDYEEMYAWNVFTMQAYGNMLYAFVTDIRMQRTTPVFGPQVKEAVVMEFKELNELIKELTRYQQKAEDRADRIAGGGIGSRPIEKALNNFFDKKKHEDAANGPPPNAIVIAGDSSGSTPTPTPTPTPGFKPDPDSLPPVDGKGFNGYVQPKISNKYIDGHTMDFGITNTAHKVAPTMSQSLKIASTSSNKRASDLNSGGNDYNKRQRMFHSFSGR